MKCPVERLLKYSIDRMLDEMLNEMLSVRYRDSGIDTLGIVDQPAQ